MVSAVRMVFRDRVFEEVTGVRVVVGARDFEEVAEFGQEKLGIGALRRAGGRPMLYEVLNIPLRHGAD